MRCSDGGGGGVVFGKPIERSQKDFTNCGRLFSDKRILQDEGSSVSSSTNLKRKKLIIQTNKINEKE